MSTFAMLDAIALSISMIIAASLTLVVMGYGLKRTINRAYALFALMIAIWALCDLFEHMILLLGVGGLAFVVELSFLAQLVMGPLLLMLTVCYLNRRTRRTDLAVGLGLAVIAVLCIPIFRHQLIFTSGLDVYGMPDTHLNTGAIIIVQICTVFDIWSLVLFWQERRRISEPYLLWGVFVIQAGYFAKGLVRFIFPIFPVTSITTIVGLLILGYGIISRQFLNPLRELTEELEHKVQERTQELEVAYAEMEKKVEERTAELQQEIVNRERLQQDVIEAQKQAIQELSTPIIPVMERIIIMPLVGNIDSERARNITRGMLAGIQEHRAKIVIMDITGVSIVDSEVANHLNKTIQAARLKGARTILTGIADAVAETIVDLGIDWSGIKTLRDLQTGLRIAMADLEIAL